MTIDHAPSKGCVVIVEQDDLIRDLLARWLTEAGYEIAMEGTQPSAAVLVIADVPHPSRAESVARDLATRYTAPVLITSGRFRRDAAASDEAARQFGVRRVLPKPFTRDEFLVAVGETLQAGRI